jgi:hypothetical protein
VGSGRLLPHIQAIDSLLLHSIPDPMTVKEIDYSGEEKNVTLDEDLDYSPE